MRGYGCQPPILPYQYCHASRSLVSWALEPTFTCPQPADANTQSPLQLTSVVTLLRWSSSASSTGFISASPPSSLLSAAAKGSITYTDWAVRGCFASSARICSASPPFCCRTSIGGHRTARSASWHNSSICLQFRPCFRNITEMQTTTRGRAASLSQGSIVTPLRRGCNVRAPVHTCPLSQPAAKIASNEVCGGSARAVAVGSLVRRAEDGAVGKRCCYSVPNAHAAHAVLTFTPQRPSQEFLLLDLL